MPFKKLRLATVIPIIIALLLGIFAVVATVQNVNLRRTADNLTTQTQELKKEVQKLQDQNKTLNDTVAKQKDENDRLKAKAGVTSTSTKNDGPKTAYLTFDDGPSSNTTRLLDTLKQNDVKATFFVIANGKDTPETRTLLKRIADEGHTIGIHSYTHDYKYIYASEENFFADFQKMNDMIVSSTGINPKFIRFPGGTNNTISFKYHGNTAIMPTLLKDVNAKGFTACDWNAGGMDAVIPIPSKDALVKGVLDTCKGKNNATILLHDNQAHGTSVDAVPDIIKSLKAQGYTFKAITSPEEAITLKAKEKR